jgi:putative hemolysin
MQTTIATAEQRVPSPRLVLSMAATSEEVREVQRLRYKVFIENQGLSALATPDGLDCDEFDAACDHLIVRDTATLKVVGTYRLLNPAGARKLGRHYSENPSRLPWRQRHHAAVVRAGRLHAPPPVRIPDRLRQHQPGRWRP